MQSILTEEVEYMEKIITVLDISKYDGKVSVGEKITLVKEPDNEFDSHAIMVLNSNGEHAGYVAANEEATVLPNTISGGELWKLVDNKCEATVSEFSKSLGWAKIYKAIVVVKSEKDTDEITFLLGGGSSRYSGKQPLLDAVNDEGPQLIRITESGDSLVGEFNGNYAGVVRTDTDTMEILKQYVQDIADFKVEAVSVDKGNIVCRVLGGKQSIVSVANLDDEIQRIISEGIDTKESLEEKIEIMRRWKVDTNIMASLFKTYVKYPDSVKAKIPPKPQTIYVDTNGIARKALAYLCEGINVLFEGEKGTAKNTLAENLDYIAHRPFYEFSMNSQLSNADLLGAKTFDRDEISDQEYLTMAASLDHLMSYIRGDNSSFTDEEKAIIDKVAPVMLDSENPRNKNLGDITPAAMSEEKMIAFVKGLIPLFSKASQNIVFERSSIIEAFECGGIVVIDEINTALPHVMPVLNSILDERRRANVPGYKAISAHPNFNVIATQNRGYTGTFDSNEATMDRFTPIVFPANNGITGILQVKVPDVNYDTLVIANDVYMGLKASVESENIGDKVLSIRGFISACRVLKYGISLKEALIDNIANRATEDSDRQTIKDIIDARVK